MMDKGHLVATYKVADMYKNGYYVEKNYNKYVTMIENLYPLVKECDSVFDPIPEVYTRLARIRTEQGRTDEAIELYLDAKDVLALRIKRNAFFGNLNIMKWLIDDLYELKPFNYDNIDLFDSYVAGTTHLKDASVLEEIKIGDKLSLQREDNKFDSNGYFPAVFGADKIILVSVILFLQEMQLIFDGIGEAITPIMNIYLTEQCYQGVRKIWKVARNTAIIEGLAATVVLCIVAPFIPKVLGITDPELIRTAAAGIRIMSFGLISISYLYLLTSFYLLIDKIALGVIMCAMRDAGIGMVLVILFGKIFGIYGVFAAILIAPVIAVVITQIYVMGRKGKENWPLLIYDKEKNVRGGFFEFSVTPDEIMENKDLIEKLLLDEGFPRKNVIHALLIFEEMFMLIYERNKGKEVGAECSIIFEDEKIRIICRDNGKVLDLSEDDIKMDSFRSYVLACFMSNSEVSKKHLLTISFTRNMFELSMKKDEEN